MQDFDIARHQPHPPGYPVFIALGKLSTAAARRAGAAAPEAAGLACWSALSATALVALLFVLFRQLGRFPAPERASGTPAVDGVDRARATDRRAAAAAAVAVLSPLFWFTAIRPLSDMTGLAAAVLSQALVLAVLGRERGRTALIGGGFAAGLAIGVRSQAFLLTLPPLALAVVLPDPRFRVRDRLAAVAAAILGVLAWAVPMIAASGGLQAYAAALGTQAGEDFSGVVMLWNVRSPRVALDALTFSFLWPWGSVVAGAVVLGAAAAGAARTGWRHPRELGLLALGFGPYAVFHLLFHEVVTVRYALPLVVPIAYLATSALDRAPRVMLPAAAAIFGVVSLASALPATVSYARQGSPTFAALRALRPGASTGAARPGMGTAVQGVDAVGMHAVARRAVQWDRAALPMRVLDAPHGEEWLTLVEEWRAHPASPVAFVADPRRTDLGLIDPAARTLVASWRWPFVEPPFVGGARPGAADLYRFRPPDWMLDRGWALTAEVAGVTARQRLGPHRQPSVAWVRTGGDQRLLMLGVRHLGPPGAGQARLTLTIGGRPLRTFDAGPGFFLQLIPLPAGTLAATEAYAPLAVRSETAAGGAEIPVALEQFDLRGPGVPMVGVAEGWQEPEFNPATARAWRWASDRAVLWVRPVGRDVTLTLEGESPLRYFDRPPVVAASVGGSEVARFSPASAFRQEIVLPAQALAAANGQVILTSDRHFVPGERDGSPDRRRLALRIYTWGVR